MASSTKREALPTQEEPEASKKPKIADDVSPPSSEPELKPRVSLNSADCDLDFTIEGNGLLGSSLYEQGFAYCWSGARATVGITAGKYCFGCKVKSYQPVEMEDTTPNQQNLCRVGVSRGDDAVGSLGETAYSFGYGGTGKFSNAGKFSDCGGKFGIGDTIVCAVNLEDKPLASISFSKNGKCLSTAMKFNAGPLGLAVVDSPVKTLEWESAVFPHVLLKNVGVELQFSVEDGLVAVEGYKPWAAAVEDGNVIMGPVFDEPKDCEVMMMVGLPASGKTTWAEKWVKEHPEKRYVLLGTNMVLDQMKVPGLLRKQNYNERFEHLMSRATQIFNTLLSRAATTPRNYIIDQTNVYKNARKRKLRPFNPFKKMAVVVFPSPEEVKARSKKRVGEMGKEVPADAVNEMLVNYVLPVSKDMARSDELFDEVMFVELNREESQRHLDEIKQELARKSNMNSNNSLPHSCGNSVQSYHFSPYYGESPVWPYPTPSPQYHGDSTATTGNWNNSSVLPSNCQYHIPNQANAYQTHQGALPLGSGRSFPEPYQGNQNSPVPWPVTPGGSYYANPTSGVDPRQTYATPYAAATNPYFGHAVQPSPIGHAAPQLPRVVPPAYIPNPSPPAYGGSPYGTMPPRPQSGPYPGAYAHPGPQYS